MHTFNTDTIKAFLLQLQANICQSLESVETTHKFETDTWQSKLGTGQTKVLKNGHVFESAGVNFSHVKGEQMPESATAHRPELAGAAYEAMGVSLVIHPQNPYIPTSHANVRFFVAYPVGGKPVWWFGGGFDLTPFYPFKEDIIHWHQTAKNICTPYGDNVYPQYKKWCDEYFFIKHRDEARGVGGLFFDDLNQWNFETCFKFIQDIGNGFLEAYLPIVQKRKDTSFGERERAFQLYCRGRYVEFNLVWDRGTLFGLQSGGRTESILMSMPPNVRFEYQYTPEPNSPEAKLTEYLQIQDWV